MPNRLSDIAARAASKALFDLGQDLENRQFITDSGPAGKDDEGYDFALTRYEKHYWGIGVREDGDQVASEVFYRSIPSADDDATAGQGWERRETGIELTGTNGGVDTEIIAGHLRRIIRDEVLDDAGD